MKKQIKILSVIVLIIFTLIIFKSVVNADTGEMITSLSNPTYADTEEIVDIGEKIVGIIQIIGTVVAVVIMVILGIKYITSSIEEKADIKKAMIPYVIGAILIFSTTSIVRVVYSLVKPQEYVSGPQDTHGWGLDENSDDSLLQDLYKKKYEEKQQQTQTTYIPNPSDTHKDGQDDQAKIITDKTTDDMTLPTQQYQTT